MFRFFILSFEGQGHGAREGSFCNTVDFSAFAGGLAATPFGSKMGVFPLFAQTSEAGGHEIIEGKIIEYSEPKDSLG
jgi:hypothetical protein